MKTKTIMIFIFLLFVSSFTQAGVIYDESSSGDLATFDPIVLNLSVGVNSVLGSSEYRSNDADFDGFNIYLAPSQILTSVSYIISNILVSNTSSLDTGLYLKQGTSTLDQTSVDILGPVTQSLFTNTMPVSGEVSLVVDPWYLGRTGDGGSWDYEIQFNVTSVPEPSALALMGLGLLGFIVTRTRRYKFQK